MHCEPCQQLLAAHSSNVEWFDMNRMERSGITVRQADRNGLPHLCRPAKRAGFGGLSSKAIDIIFGNSLASSLNSDWQRIKLSGQQIDTEGLSFSDPLRLILSS